MLADKLVVVYAEGNVVYVVYWTIELESELGLVVSCTTSRDLQRKTNQPIVVSEVLRAYYVMVYVLYAYGIHQRQRVRGHHQTDVLEVGVRKRIERVVSNLVDAH